ncbi:phage terminase small subunit P27 family [Sphaerisporangium sp. NPDC051017]|uniref:phage terminase small subunit P27 family n=1 Tax=Sphaerisporangium sp. NPDC051017 TaxID=3154636 RepID=UPI0034234430
MAASAGRKSRPPRLKLLEGRGNGRDSGGRPVKPEPGFRRLPPVKPDDLSLDAAALWDLIVDELARLQLIKEIDGAALQVACEAYARWRRASAQLAVEGFTYTAASGLVKVNPLCGVVERASAEYRAWMAEFGMSPASESKLGASPDDDGDDNPFA